MEHKTLTSAIAGVIRDTGNVQQTGENKYHGYFYATDYDITKECHAAMGKNGVSCVLHEIKRSEFIERGKNSTEFRGLFVFHYHWSGGDDYLRSVCWGVGRSNDEKAPLKALTSAKKYSHLVTFTIASHLDPEKDPPEVETLAPPAPAPTKPQKSARERAGLVLKSNEKPSSHDWTALFKEKGLPPADFKVFGLGFFSGRDSKSLTADDYRKLKETKSADCWRLLKTYKAKK